MALRYTPSTLRASASEIEAHHLWRKAKYGGMDVTEAQRAKEFRDENMSLWELVTDLSPGKEALQIEPIACSVALVERTSELPSQIRLRPGGTIGLLPSTTYRCNEKGWFALSFVSLRSFAD